MDEYKEYLKQISDLELGLKKQEHVDMIAKLRASKDSVSDGNLESYEHLLNNYISALESIEQEIESRIISPEIYKKGIPLMPPIPQPKMKPYNPLDNGGITTGFPHPETFDKDIENAVETMMKGFPNPKDYVIPNKEVFTPNSKEYHQDLRKRVIENEINSPLLHDRFPEERKRRIDLENNNERFVAGRNDKIEARETARYEYAGQFVKENDKVLDIGCSSGYGCRIITHNLNWTGIDYDETIVKYARSEFPECRFERFDITTPEFINFLKTEKFDTIIAFEVLEHIDNGKELAQILKQHCKTLICSVPYNEPVGFWGEHHKLHGLTERDFAGFEYEYMSFDGDIRSNAVGYGSNLDTAVMLMNWKTPFQNEQDPKIKYSIVIPTFNHLQDLLIPCLDSVISTYMYNENIKTGTMEVIIVANGCTDGTIEYLQNRNVNSNGTIVKLLQFPEPLGYTRAANEGIKVSRGEYVVLLNNDVVVYDKDWLEKLSEPFVTVTDKGYDSDGILRDIYFRKSNVGETGALLRKSHVEGLEDFIIGFCSMIPRKVLNEVGLMDEQFSPGGMDDADLSIRIQRAGYDILPVKLNLYHPNESSTFHDLDTNQELFGGKWQEIFDKNIQKLKDKWKPIEKTEYKPHVLCEVTTKNRYFTTLPLALMSVAMQTRVPDELVIYDDTDDDKKCDILENPIYKYIISIIESKGIRWYWLWTNRQGQVFSHEDAQGRAKEFVWRLDDDCVAEPNVLEELLEYVKNEEIGAVGTLILTPNMIAGKELASYKISDIYSSPNWQWFEHPEKSAPFDVEHLHCSFLYRKGITHYDLRLSPIGHREETIFTHNIFRAGYKLAILNHRKTWHLKNPEGGIRSHSNNDYGMKDEQLFSQWMAGWEVKPTNRHIIYCCLGLGDHYILRQALPKIIESRGAENLIIVCYHAEVFADFGIKCIGENEAKAIGIIGENQVIDNIYAWMWGRNWKSSVVEAYERQNI